VYATSAGKTAADGTGRNGLFTSGLLKNLDSANVEVKEIFNRTGADVLKDSGGEQRPAVYSQFFGNAYFSGSGGAVKAAAAEKESTKKVKPVTIKAIDYTVNFAPDNKLIPLFKTIKDGNIEKVREQLNMRQNPNGKDSNGNPALFYAIEAGDPEIVKLLIANKANVNLTNNKKQTPLAFAAYKAKNEIVEILVKSGADVNQTDGNKITALQVARGAKNEALVKYLIDAGAKD
jgi:hypothetical protein